MDKYAFVLSDELKLKLFNKSYLKMFIDTLAPENSEELESTYLGAPDFPLKSSVAKPNFIRKPIELNEDSLYVGELLDNKPHGLGYFMDSKGNYYEGFFENGVFSGKGRLFKKKGEIIVGDWVEGDCTYGIINNFNHKTYKGELKNLEPNGTGKESCDDYTYKGNFYLSKKHGLGKIQWTNGNWYEGEFIMGRIEGKGKYHWIDSEYEGQFKANKMDGHGIQLWNNGSRYEGEMKNGIKNGYGIYSCDSRTYSGNWKNGKEDGKGSVVENGEVFEGVWQNGNLISQEAIVSLSYEEPPISPIMKNASVKSIRFCEIEIPQKFKVKCMKILDYRIGLENIDWKNDDKLMISEDKWKKQGKGVYYGETKASGQAHGKGFWICSSQIYEGFFKDGEREGFGRQINSHQEIYTGNWHKGVKQGYGVLLKKDTKYTGEWENNTFHGKGILTKDSLVYDGEWKNGLQHGNGILKYPDEKIYKGEFFEGVVQGNGTLVYPDGHGYKGIWNSGSCEKILKKFVKEEEADNEDNAENKNSKKSRFETEAQKVKFDEVPAKIPFMVGKPNYEEKEDKNIFTRGLVVKVKQEKPETEPKDASVQNLAKKLFSFI
ncbi:hypothetical protein SteCoe_4844 [Stentor coeruleus]|uniref:Uncharacterized protein n=1 Tax=Stentor coeruleus TaxID=5963 RepID=A0A1R2CTR7_9CILI|nr:hypothetical protein SteCoe_4844 [Stentor coeruleus]